MASAAEPAVCPTCHQPAVEDDETLGMKICTACGMVVEDGIQIRSEAAWTGDGTSSHSEAQNQFGQMVRRCDDEVASTPSFERRTATCHSTDGVWKLKRSGPDSALRFQKCYGKNETVAAKLGSVGVRLKLTRTSMEQVNLVMEQLAQAQGGRHHRPLDFLLAGCVYMVSRQNRRSLSMAEVAESLQCTAASVGKAYKFVVSTLFPDEVLPQLDMENLVSRGIAAVTELLPESSQHDRFQVMKDAQLLVRFAQVQALVTGRKPMPMVAAALHLALALTPRPPPLEQVCEGLYCPKQMADKRLKELRAKLIEVAAVQLPWLKLTAKSKPPELVRNLRVILQYLTAALSVPSSGNLAAPDSARDDGGGAKACAGVAAGALPPAFCKTATLQRERGTAVAAAQARIAATQAAWRGRCNDDDTGSASAAAATTSGRGVAAEGARGSSAGSVPSKKRQRDELVYERLLLEGVSEAQITDASCSLQGRLRHLEHLQPTPDYSHLDPDGNLTNTELNQYLRNPAELTCAAQQL